MTTVAVDLRALVPAATGIGVYTREMLAALAARGSRRWVGLAHREPRGAAGLRELGIAIEHQPAPLGVLWQQLVLPRRLARGDADLFWSPLATLPLRCPLPAVVTVHDLTALLYPETHTLKVRWSLLPFLGRSLAAARRVAAISEATARDLAFHFPEAAARVRVVGAGVEPAFRPASEDEVAAIRAELGAPEGYVFYAGTLEPRKNIGALLDAWQALRAEDEEGTPPLVLAGGRGWGSRALLRRIEALRGEGVVHLGRVERARLVRLFQGARVFAYPSLYEGFGLPPLEAMACGVPVVAGDSSSLPEVVGDAGLLVPARDRGALRDALARVLGDPGLAADLGARGRERAARFTWSAAAAAMDQVLDEALAG
jgi:glycosyltransferase involved in cell wall biosynthesis